MTVDTEQPCPSPNFYKNLLDSLFDAVFTVNRFYQINYWNTACARLTGFGAKEMLGAQYYNTPFGFISEDDAQQHFGLQTVMQNGVPGTWKGYITRKNGQRIPVRSHITPVLNQESSIVGAAVIMRDISAHIALEQAHKQLLHLSRKDQLTGLTNRSALRDMLKAEIERSRRYQQPFSLILCDIDLFKRINDRYGHDTGDLVLAKIGALLAHNVRQPDIVGRWGGEEFLIATPGSDAEAAAALGQRLRGFMMDIPQDEFPEQVTASFGVAQLHDQPGLDQLLYSADQALYQAKGQGRNCVVVAEAENASDVFSP